MRLREYFAGQDEMPNVEEESDLGIAATLGCSNKTKKKSNFTAKPGRNKWLDTYIEAVRKDVIESINKTVEMNVKERRAGNEIITS